MLRSPRAALFLLLLWLPVFRAAHAEKHPPVFDGYVTASANGSFDVGAVHANCLPSTDVERVFSDVTVQAGCDPATLPWGAQVHVEGIWKGQNFSAGRVRVLEPKGIRHEKDVAFTGTGLIQFAPEAGAPGSPTEVWVDGSRLAVGSGTQLAWTDGTAAHAGDLKTDVWVDFTAHRKPDGSVVAEKLVLRKNDLSADEASYRKQTQPMIVPPDYATGTPGKYDAGKLAWTLEILPDQSVQEYVTRVGTKLVPRYQQEMPDSSPTKIHFRFLVIRHPSKWKQSFNDAFSTADGVVVVPDNVLANLENEAQLAAILSNCIESVIEKQVYLHHTRITTQKWTQVVSEASGVYGLPVMLGNGKNQADFWQGLTERAARIEFQELLEAGYDLREVPYAWEAAAHKKNLNPWTDAEYPPPGLVRHLMEDLQLNYAGTDYAKLTTGREAYQAMLTGLEKADPKLPHRK
jgi:hypothetical protein